MIDQRKRAVVRFLEAMAAHDVAPLSDLLAADAIYWTCGKPHLFSYAGERDRDEFLAYMGQPSIFVGGASVEMGAMTAEDDRVAAEARTRGVLADGREYTNAYHYLFTFRDDKIVRVKEYMDTQAAAEFFSL